MSEVQPYHAQLLSEPDAHDIGLLKDEAARIKKALYAEYGEAINSMLAAERARSSAEQEAEKTQVDRWQDQIEELIKYQKPLRQQIKQCQHEAIAKLVEEAKASQARGIDVSDKLTMLLALQGTPPSA